MTGHVDANHNKASWTVPALSELDVDMADIEFRNSGPGKDGALAPSSNS